MPPVMKKIGKPEQAPVAKSNDNTTAPALIESNEQLAIPLPSFLQRDTVPELANSLGTEYLGFADTRSKNWPMLSAAGIPDGSAFILKDGHLTALQSIDCFVLAGTSYLTHMEGQDMKLVYCSKDIKEENPDPEHRQPHYVAVLLVDVEGTLVPIRGDFRGTKSNGIESAFRAVEAAAKPEWLTRSDAHRVTGAFPQPWGRVMHHITTQPTMGKKSGRRFHVTRGTSEPTPAGMLQQLVEFFSNADNTKAVTAVYEGYTRRVAFLDAEAAKFQNNTLTGQAPKLPN